MPQIWVSYDELGSHYRCTAAAAREHVRSSGWPRRKCSDGLTRVKLPTAVVSDYIRAYWYPETEPHLMASRQAVSAALRQAP